MNDFQKAFLLGKGAGQTLYTEAEFAEALENGKAEIMDIAMNAAKMAVQMEREACMKIATDMMNDDKSDAGEFWNKALKQVAQQIEARTPTKAVQ